MTWAHLVIDQISVPLNATIYGYFQCGSESVNWCEQLFHGVEGVKSNYQLSIIVELYYFYLAPGNGVLPVLCRNS